MKYWNRILLDCFICYQEQNETDILPSAKLHKPSDKKDEKQKTDVQDMGDVDMEAEIDGEKVQTTTVARGQESSINTDIDLYYATQVCGD